MEGSYRRFKKPLNDSPEVFSQPLHGNSLDSWVAKISFNFIEIGEKSLILSRENIPGQRKMAQYHIDGHEGMDSDRPIDSVLDEIDLSQKGEPYGIAFHDEIFR